MRPTTAKSFIQKLVQTKLQQSLAGTVPPHRCHLFLESAIPIAEIPAKYTTPVQRQLQLRLLRAGGLVNHVSYGRQSENASVSPDATIAPSEIVHSGIAFSSARGVLRLPRVSMDNIDEVERQLKEHMEGAAEPQKPQPTDEIHIYVCTHGNRDCRCGDTGGQVVKALREEVAKLAQKSKDGLGPFPTITVGEVSHVGGHKYAANMLIYPHGEWLGFVTPEKVPSILEELLKRPLQPFGETEAPLVKEHWRGRMGLGKDEQISLASAS